MRFDTLDQMVKDICEIGGGDMLHKEYGRVLKICVRTLQDLNLHTQIPNYKTVELEVRGNLTARMPNDVLKPLKIGRCVNGRLQEVRYAQDICMPKRALLECCDCEEEVKVYETIEQGSEPNRCDYRVDVLAESFCNYRVEDIVLSEGQVFEVLINGEWQDETGQVSEGVWVRNNSQDDITFWRISENPLCYQANNVSLQSYGAGNVSVFVSTNISDKPTIDTIGGSDIVVRITGSYDDGNGNIVPFTILDTTVASGVNWTTINNLILNADTTGIPVLITATSPFVGARFGFTQPNVELVYEIFPDNSDVFDFGFDVNRNISSTWSQSLSLSGGGSGVRAVYTPQQVFQVLLNGVWTTVALDVNNNWSEPISFGDVTGGRKVHVYDGNVFQDFLYGNNPVEILTLPCGDPIFSEEFPVTSECFVGIAGNRLEVFSDDWEDVTDRLVGLTWQAIRSEIDYTLYRIVNSSGDVLLTANVAKSNCSNSGTGLCDYRFELDNPLEEGQRLYVLINNVWVDVTESVEFNGTVWQRLQTSDLVGQWKVENDDSGCDYSFTIQEPISDCYNLFAGYAQTVVAGVNIGLLNPGQAFWCFFTPYVAVNDESSLGSIKVRLSQIIRAGDVIWSSVLSGCIGRTSLASISTGEAVEVVQEITWHLLDNEGDPVIGFPELIFKANAFGTTPVNASSLWTEQNRLIHSGNFFFTSISCSPESDGEQLSILFDGFKLENEIGESYKIEVDVNGSVFQVDPEEAFVLNLSVGINKIKIYDTILGAYVEFDFPVEVILLQNIEVQVLVNEAWVNAGDAGFTEDPLLSYTLNLSQNEIIEYRVIQTGVANDAGFIVIESGEVQADCTPLVAAEGVADADCSPAPIPAVSYQRLKSIEKVQPKCDSRGCCTKCLKPQKRDNQNSTNFDTRFIPDLNFGGNRIAEVDAFFNYNNVRGAQFFVERFGQQPHPAVQGWFNYDLVEGIIKLDGNWSEGDCLLFMYRTEMQELDGTKVVPVECFNMLLYRCKELLWNRNRPDMVNQRELYELEYKRIRRLYNRMTLQEWEDAISGYRYSAVKR